MQRKILMVMVLVGAVSMLASCCSTFNGYGRYSMKTCDKVHIEGTVYELTKQGSDFVIDSHSIARGIYRKTKPWLYTHKRDSARIDITFDTGSKDIYPLYVGSSASIFDVYAHPWEMTRSTNASFVDNQWLVSHRWNSSGIFFDLQRMGASETDWTLMRPDIFVPADGSEVEVAEINTKVKIIDFDAANKKAKVVFTQM